MNTLLQNSITEQPSSVLLLKVGPIVQLLKVYILVDSRSKRIKVSSNLGGEESGYKYTVTLRDSVFYF
jgi:hypothetical protein